MRVIAFLLRVFSYLFHFVLSVFLLGIGLIGKMSSETASFYTPLLPGDSGDQAGYAVWLGLAGLVSVILAATGRFRPLLVVWACAVVVLCFRGLFWGTYTYQGRDPFESALWFFGGTVLAFIGSLCYPKKRPATASYQ